MSEIINYTIDEYRKSDWSERQKYIEWRKKQRQQDRKELRHIRYKEFYRLNKERINERDRQNYKKKKERKNLFYKPEPILLVYLPPNH